MLKKWKLNILGSFTLFLFVTWIAACGNPALMMENEELKKQNDELKKENTNLKTSLKKAKTKKTLVKNIEKATGELDEWKDKVAKLEKDVEEKDGVIMQKSNEIASFEEAKIEMERVKGEREAIEEEKERLKIEYEHLAMDLENVRTEANRNKSEANKLKSEIVQLQKAYANYAEGIRAQAENEAMKAMKMKSQNQEYYAQELTRLKQRLQDYKDGGKKKEVKKQPKKVRPDQLASGLRKDLANEEASGDVSIESYKGKVFVSITNDVMFDLGNHELKNTSKNVLNKIGRQLKKFPERSIIVEGHTDNIPMSKKGKKKYRSNWELSTLRATEVVHYLINKYGIAPKRIMAGGRSKYDPAVPNTSSKNRAKNRRVSIIIGPYNEKENQIFSEKYNGKSSNGGEYEAYSNQSGEVYGEVETGIDPSTKDSSLKTKDDKVVVDEGENRTSSEPDIEIYGSDEM